MKRKLFNAKEKLSYFSLSQTATAFIFVYFFLLFKHRKIRILQEEKNSNCMCGQSHIQENLDVCGHVHMCDRTSLVIRPATCFQI